METETTTIKRALIVGTVGLVGWLGLICLTIEVLAWWVNFRGLTL